MFTYYNIRQMRDRAHLCLVAAKSTAPSTFRSNAAETQNQSEKRNKITSGSSSSLTGSGRIRRGDTLATRPRSDSGCVVAWWRRCGGPGLFELVDIEFECPLDGLTKSSLFELRDLPQLFGQFGVDPDADGLSLDLAWQSSLLSDVAKPHEMACGSMEGALLSRAPSIDGTGLDCPSGSPGRRSFSAHLSAGPS
jgi:hypothetical protein